MMMTKHIGKSGEWITLRMKDLTEALSKIGDDDALVEFTSLKEEEGVCLNIQNLHIFGGPGCTKAFDILKKSNNQK